MKRLMLRGRLVLHLAVWGCLIGCGSPASICTSMHHYQATEGPRAWAPNDGPPYRRVRATSCDTWVNAAYLASFEAHTANVTTVQRLNAARRRLARLREAQSTAVEATQ